MRRFAQPLLALAPILAGNATALSQPAQDDTAFLTIVDGEGVTVDYGADETKIDARALARSSVLADGARIRTHAAGTAVLLFPNSGAAIHLSESADVRITEPSSPAHSLNLIVAAGRVTMVRGSRANNWLVLGAEIAGGPAGYVVSKDACVLVEVLGGKIAFSARRGEVLLFEQRVPRGAIFGPVDSPINPNGVVIRQGQKRTLGVAGDPVPDPQSGVVVPLGVVTSAWRFADAQGVAWLGRAEEGDFTPVTAAGGAASELLSSEVEPSLVFDQARPVLAPATGSVGTTPVQPRPSAAQTLVESNIPGTVVAARRFAGSRIIGITGQSGTGALFVNITPLTLPIRLGGR